MSQCIERDCAFGCASQDAPKSSGSAFPARTELAHLRAIPSQSIESDISMQTQRLRFNTRCRLNAQNELSPKSIPVSNSARSVGQCRKGRDKKCH
jgi:hypothetical protein